MSIESQKSELIHWIQQLKDESILQKIMQLKNDQKPKAQNGKRNGFGQGKHIFTYVSEDFNESLDF